MKLTNAWKYLPIGSYYNFVNQTTKPEERATLKSAGKILFHGAYMLAGMGLIVIYTSMSISTGDINPLTQQSKIQDAASAHSLLEKKVFALADKDGNSVLSLAEADELYRRAGIEVKVPNHIFSGDTFYLQGLTEKNLETALRSYEGEK